MVWLIIGACALAVVVVLVVVMTILRFNQLSMARSLCDEAKRQLIVELRARHALLPAYIGTLQQLVPNDLGYVALALASAERAPFGHRGAAAENALTKAIDDAAPIPGTLSDRALAGESAMAMPAGPDDELDTTVELLHGQLGVLTERIHSGARIYNTNVKRYHHQRNRPLSRLFQNVFIARESFTERCAKDENNTHDETGVRDESARNETPHGEPGARDGIVQDETPRP